MGMIYHSQWEFFMGTKIFRLSDLGKSRLAFSSKDLQKGFLIPLLRWQKLGKWLGNWLGKWLRGPHPLPCSWPRAWRKGERRISVGYLQFTCCDRLVSHIHKFRNPGNSSPAHSNNNNNNNMAGGYSKSLHCPEGYHRDGSPDGQLHISPHHSRQTGGMFCTHLIYALRNDLQKVIGKRVLTNEQFTPWIDVEKNVIQIMPQWSRVVLWGKRCHLPML